MPLRDAIADPGRNDDDDAELIDLLLFFGAP
jgi:hypothetical protein